MIRDYVIDSDSDHNAKESPESPSPVEIREKAGGLPWRQSVQLERDRLLNPNLVYPAAPNYLSNDSELSWPVEPLEPAAHRSGICSTKPLHLRRRM